MSDKVANHAPDMQFYKARVLYDGQGVVDVQYAPYTMREIRSLKVVVDDRIDYSFKSAAHRRHSRCATACRKHNRSA